jgi:hypothetical protein
MKEEWRYGVLRLCPVGRTKELSGNVGMKLFEESGRLEWSQ